MQFTSVLQSFVFYSALVIFKDAHCAPHTVQQSREQGVQQSSPDSGDDPLHPINSSLLPTAHVQQSATALNADRQSGPAFHNGESLNGARNGLNDRGQPGNTNTARTVGDLAPGSGPNRSTVQEARTGKAEGGSYEAYEPGADVSSSSRAGQSSTNAAGSSSNTNRVSVNREGRGGGSNDVYEVSISNDINRVSAGSYNNGYAVSSSINGASREFYGQANPNNNNNNEGKQFAFNPDSINRNQGSFDPNKMLQWYVMNSSDPNAWNSMSGSQYNNVRQSRTNWNTDADWAQTQSHVQQATQTGAGAGMTGSQQWQWIVKPVDSTSDWSGGGQQQGNVNSQLTQTLTQRPAPQFQTQSQDSAGQQLRYQRRQPGQQSSPQSEEQQAQYQNQPQPQPQDGQQQGQQFQPPQPQEAKPWLQQGAPPSDNRQQLSMFSYPQHVPQWNGQVFQTFTFTPGTGAGNTGGVAPLSPSLQAGGQYQASPAGSGYPFSMYQSDTNQAFTQNAVQPQPASSASRAGSQAAASWAQTAGKQGGSLPSGSGIPGFSMSSGKVNNVFIAPQSVTIQQFQLPTYVTPTQGSGGHDGYLLNTVSAGPQQTLVASLPQPTEVSVAGSNTGSADTLHPTTPGTPRYTLDPSAMNTLQGLLRLLLNEGNSMSVSEMMHVRERILSVIAPPETPELVSMETSSNGDQSRTTQPTPTEKAGELRNESSLPASTTAVTRADHSEMEPLTGSQANHTDGGSEKTPGNESLLSPRTNDTALNEANKSFAQATSPPPANITHSDSKKLPEHQLSVNTSEKVTTAEPTHTDASQSTLLPVTLPRGSYKRAEERDSNRKSQPLSDEEPPEAEDSAVFIPDMSSEGVSVQPRVRLGSGPLGANAVVDPAFVDFSRLNFMGNTLLGLLNLTGPFLGGLPSSAKYQALQQRYGPPTAGSQVVTAVGPGGVVLPFQSGGSNAISATAPTNNQPSQLFSVLGLGTGQQNAPSGVVSPFFAVSQGLVPVQVGSSGASSPFLTSTTGQAGQAPGAGSVGSSPFASALQFGSSAPQAVFTNGLSSGLSNGLSSGRFSFPGIGGSGSLGLSNTPQQGYTPVLSNGNVQSGYIGTSNGNAPNIVSTSNANTPNYIPVSNGNTQNYVPITNTQNFIPVNNRDTQTYIPANKGNTQNYVPINNGNAYNFIPAGNANTQNNILANTGSARSSNTNRRNSPLKKLTTNTTTCL